MEGKSVFRKGLIIGIIMLFFVASFSPNILVKNVKSDPGNNIILIDDF